MIIVGYIPTMINFLLLFLLRLRSVNSFSTTRSVIHPILFRQPSLHHQHQHHHFLRLSSNSESNEKGEGNGGDTEWQEQLNQLTAPVQEVLDGATEGWALSYADLRPDTHQTTPGLVFLLTNVAYAAAGLALTFHGDVWFGLLTDVTALVSFNYHYNQLQVEGDMGAPAVRLALLIDYAFASVAILTATTYLWTSPSFPLEGALYAAASMVFLGLCWVYEEGRTYMVLHGMWHLLSAYAGYLIGMTHLGL